MKRKQLASKFDELERLLSMPAPAPADETRTDEQLIEALKRGALLDAVAIREAAHTPEQKQASLAATKTAFALYGIPTNDEGGGGGGVLIEVIEAPDVDDDGAGESPEAPDQAQSAADQSASSVH
ncbi:MAG: hypothetical protein HOW73_47640 [Polyangiaceae bacterium]|nr:hypothetical protein [Polyangiaceae bacterium]